MKRKISLILILSMLFLVACESKEQAGEDVKVDQFLEVVREESFDDSSSILKSKIANMTLEEKLGQLLMLGFEGKNLSEDLKGYIDKLKPGGIIFFKRNLNSQVQMVNMVNNIKEYNEKNIGMFLSIDEEGGLVSRLPKEYEKLPNSILLENRQELSLELGEILGERLMSLGLNLNYAPVMDIHSNPYNPVINERAFGRDEKSVSINSNNVLKGMGKKNIIAVGKHFPGHGDTSIDSHLDLPVIDKTREEMENFEMLPFKYNIENGLEGLMVGHLLVPSVDDKFATVSKKWLSEIIRQDLGFEGLIFSDDMTMSAIANNMSIEEASKEFIVNGGDILLICHGKENPYKVQESLLRAVENGEFKESDLDDKLFRILSLKEKHKIDNEKIDMIKLEVINERVRSFRRELGEK